MNTPVWEWLTSNGFERFLALDEDAECLDDLALVTSKTIQKLGGTKDDHASLVTAVRQHLDKAAAEQHQTQSALNARLPIFVAGLHHELLQETHERVRLARLFDLSEMLARWVAAVLVSALREPGSAELPAGLAQMLREQQAIVREIGLSIDSPMDRIHTSLKQSIWRDHPLGRPVHGTAEDVAKMTREDIIYFLQEHYTPDRVIVCAAGNVDHGRSGNAVYQNLMPIEREIAPGMKVVGVSKKIDVCVLTELKMNDVAILPEPAQHYI